MITLIQPSLHSLPELVDIILDEVEAYDVDIHHLREEWDSLHPEEKHEFAFEIIEEALRALPKHYEVRLEPDLIVISEEGQE